MFNTTILNNDRIPGFEELLTRCSQEETRMMELDMPSNRNDPIAFSAHAKKKNNASSKNQYQGRPSFKNGRKGRCFICNKFGHYARECHNRRDTPHDDDNHNNNNFRGNNNQRNGKFNNRGKRNAPATQHGNGRPPKGSRNYRYDESNVVENKQKEFYLRPALSTASPSDTLGNWLIDSGTSRHFTRYKEALSNLIENVMFLFLVFLTTWLGWTFRAGVDRSQVQVLLHQRTQGLQEVFHGVVRNFYKV